MKKFISVLAALLLVVVIVLIVKTSTYTFKGTENYMKQQDTETIRFFPSEQAIQRFVGGIRIPTVSNEVYEETDFGPFDRFMAYLPEVYPRVYETMETHTVNTYGMVFRWKGKNSGLKPILFLSHYDVVPVTGYDPSVYAEDDTFLFSPQDEPLSPLDNISEEWDYPPLFRGRG